MSLSADDNTVEMNKVLEDSNLYFSIAFVVEAILKIYAMKFGPYISNSWNKLDLIVVISSVFEFVT